MKAVADFVTSKVFLWIIGLALVVGGTIVVISKNRDEKLVATGKEAGSSTAVAAGQAVTLDQTEKANAAGNEVRNDRGNARYDECVRDSTPATRGNCARYRTNQPLPD